jgi:hypothetical protein
MTDTGGPSGISNRPLDGDVQTNGGHGGRPGSVALIGSFAALAAVVAAVAAVPSDRRVASTLLAIGALVLILAWWLSSATETEWFKAGIKAIVIAALAGFACYLFIVPSATASPKLGSPKAPKLIFPEGASARVPYCSSYTVLADTSLPPRSQVVMFDAPTNADGKVDGDFNYDDQARYIGSERYEDKVLYIGSAQNGAGLTAEVVAAVIADGEANILNAVQASPTTGWGLKNLPPLLTSKVLQVTRTGDGHQCPGAP